MFAQHDRTLPPLEALGRIRDLFAGYDYHEGARSFGPFA